MSSIEGIIKKGDYFDSITLMIVSKKMREMRGVVDSAIVMGSAENISILQSAGLMVSSFQNCTDSDLLLVVHAENEGIANSTLLAADEMLLHLKKNKKAVSGGKEIIKSLEAAKARLPKANLTIISVAGKFAYAAGLEALYLNQNIMLFSDNMSIDEERSLKELAKKKNLLVMGPDCGTAIVSGAPLAFANSVREGKVGIVGASGTGMQEISTLIHNMGQGISHALGTGGRDIKEEIGGISFLHALSMLKEDEKTKVIVLVAKPPHQKVLEKIGEAATNIKKPIVAVFLGATRECVEKYKMIYAPTLEQGAFLAAKILDQKAKIESETYQTIEKPKGVPLKYLRALYSGGTFCYESLLMLKELGIENLYSNAHATSVKLLSNSNVSQEHTVIDLGEDEFTKGRPHPMIDYTLRNRRIMEEIRRDDTGVILLDLVIGYGANMNPREEFIPTIIQAKKEAPHIPIICFITGTDSDPQNRQLLIGSLKKCGALVVYTNAQALQLAVRMI